MDPPQADPDRPTKPRLRGVSHQYAFFASLAAGAVLVASAETTRARVAAGVFGLSLSGLLGTSALYHRVDWRPDRRALMRRLDHSMIFVLIAGSFTPFAMVALAGARAAGALAIVWGAALVGALLRVVWLAAPKWLTAVACVAMGWLVVAAMPEVVAARGWPPVVLVALGGGAYTVGAAIYALKRPDPLPGVFGYHEVFHALVIVGGALHYAAIAGWVV